MNTGFQINNIIYLCIVVFRSNSFIDIAITLIYKCNFKNRFLIYTKRKKIAEVISAMKNDRRRDDFVAIHYKTEN